MIAAEELGVTSGNVAGMAKNGNPDVRRLLGVTPGNGKALGLDEAWAYNVIKTVGNYGEVYERNVGAGSPIKLPRGVNVVVRRRFDVNAAHDDDEQDGGDQNHGPRVGASAFSPAALTLPETPAPAARQPTNSDLRGIFPRVAHYNQRH